MPYNLLDKPLGELITTVNNLCKQYSEGRINSEDAGIFGRFFGPKHINPDRVSDIKFSQKIVKKMADVNKMLLAQWDSSVIDQATYANETILFLKRALAGSLFIDLLEIRSSYTMSDYKNSDLAKLILNIFDIRDVDEVPKSELCDNFRALDRYMTITQALNPEEPIVWHPLKNLDVLLAAIKKHTPTPKNAEIEFTSTGMVV